MFKRLLLIVTLGFTLSGCFMAPLALIGPATNGWSTASLIQSGFSTGANFVIKKSTGKSFSEHAFDTISTQILQQAYFPISRKSLAIAP